jgi:hypothetical protein
MLCSLMLLDLGKSNSIVSEIAFRPGSPFSVQARNKQNKLTLSAEKRGANWEVWVTATENGKNIIGADQRFPADRFRQVLDGRYSLVAKQPDGRVKLFQDRVSGMARFYWGFSQQIAGKRVSGWTEMPPLPVSELYPTQFVTIGNVLRHQSDRFIPTKDQDDLQTGFKVIKRPYHWSGTDGNAWVITFGDECKWRKQDIKLVFPEGSSWVPGFQLSSKHLVQFEFLETWGGGAKGCYEPMSDRVNRFSKVELIEDRKDRKTLKWTYQLINPDYIRWGEALGSKEEPIAEEIWTVYPDATVKRTQRYWAPLDTSEQQHWLGAQVAEFDVVWSSDSLPEEVTPKNAATIFADHNTLPIEYPSARKQSDPKFGSEPMFGVAVHSLDSALPDVFAVFDQKGAINPPYQLSTDDDKDWHREQFWRFSHFPFNLEPFQYETNSQTQGRGQVSHSSLVYVGAPQDRDWASKWKRDKNGRKYREWVTTIGLAPKNDFKEMLALHRRIFGTK